MKALWYLTKMSLKNRICKALKKPVTYIYLAIGILYAMMILYGWGVLAAEGGLASVTGLVYVLTIWIYLEIGSNFITYAKRKGVIFLPSHSHLVFPTPISPKQILLHSAMKNFALTLLMDIIFAAVAVSIFHLSVGKALLLFLFSFVLEVILESSLIILLYTGGEQQGSAVKIICRCIYLVFFCVLLLLFYYLKKNGIHVSTFREVMELEALQMVPVAGWNVAAVRLIILGPTTLNVVCTVLYLLTCGVVFAAALKKQCTGEYYEDAAKFADDYVERKNRSKKGEFTFSGGKKRKFRKAGVIYKGSGAKAVFYRQLLEYKKERFFIFGPMTLYSVIGVIVCIAAIGRPENYPPGLALLGVEAYFVFLCTGYLGKWGKELEQPYIYLIPDSAIKKLWYATLMEHIKALVDGIIFIIPVGIAWRIPAYQMAASLVIYVVLQANRLYIKILGESILGNTLGNTGKTIFAMVVQGATIGIGVAAALLFGILVNYNLIFFILPIYCLMITMLIALLTASRFDAMEQW